MKKARIINLIGWAFIIFLTIGVIFFSEQFSWVNTSIWGFICLLIGLFLTFYESKPRKQLVRQVYNKLKNNKKPRKH